MAIRSVTGAGQQRTNAKKERSIPATRQRCEACDAPASTPRRFEGSFAACLDRDQLRFNQLTVELAGLQQLVVRAGGDDAPLVDDDDPIDVDNGRKAVRDDEGGRFVIE